MALRDVGLEAEAAARYVLITQCLQNDFFLNPDCKLCLPEVGVKQLLVSKAHHAKDAVGSEDGARQLAPRWLETGPLGLFLEAVVGERLTGETPGVLHLINIRDWHVADDAYEQERRLHGRHCEAGSWGASYLDGFAKYLDPGRPLRDGRAGFYAKGNVRIYHVHSDSLSDFRGRASEIVPGAKPRHSELERLLDVLLTGTDMQVDELRQVLSVDADLDTYPERAAAARREDYVLDQLALTALTRDLSRPTPPAYVAVVGVYTDAKVSTLLAGLNLRYDLPHLVVSDSLTATRTVERHLFALDFANKLLGVEVMHGLGDLAAFLGASLEVNESAIVAAPDFAQYKSFFLDKKSVLAHQSQRLQEYVVLMRSRSIRVYEAITRANVFLLFSGALFLIVALASSIATLAGRHSNWQTTAITGGLGLAQLVSVFFTKPMREMQNNLNNLASFTMVLESRALKQAFAEYHLTTPEVLREIRDESERHAARRQIDVLREQLDVIDTSQKFDYEALGRFVRVQSPEPIPMTTPATTNSAAAKDAQQNTEAEPTPQSTSADRHTP